MDIAIFGLGYVGVVSAACLAEAGHQVIGVDVNGTKVDMVNRGQSPIVEPQVADLLARAVAQGRLRATCDPQEAVRSTQMAWVCVSTPSQPNGNLERRFLAKVSEEIGAALREASGRYVVVIRSTALPGTTRGVVIPRLEGVSGKSAGADFGVCYHPEFLREGSSVADFAHPAKVVVGATDPLTAEVLLSLYKGIDAPVVTCTIEVAEIVKYADNSWHAVKVAFANEIGTMCKRVGLDGREVMDIFCRDHKLNLSERYLRPGFAFGGSCLPKDMRALIYEARRLDLNLPLLESVLASNQRHIERALELIAQRESRRVALLGLSFKPGTDDLRESPLVELAERLIGKGYELRIFDSNVNLSMVVGANRRFIETRIPHIAQLLVGDPAEALANAETIVVGYRDPMFDSAVSQFGGGRSVIDLAGLRDTGARAGAYDGICW
jgi:GDP-mannose 6-dehydrogenase